MALISDFVVEGARDGRSVADLMEAGAHVVTAEQCMEGIAAMVPDVQVEATFPRRHQARHRAPPDPGRGMSVERLARAYAMAARAHAGQTRKGRMGIAYLNHPRRGRADGGRGGRVGGTR